MSTRISPPIASFGAWCLIATSALATGPTDDVDYGRDVLPVLSDRCFACHGVDPGSREADLRLDVLDDAIGRVIVPGDHEASELWRRITTDDPHDVMPPPRAKRRPLSEVELDAIRRWIDAGADQSEHWAYVAPERPDVPEDPSGWARGPIDAFVAATLAAHDATPSPPADRSTLLRRVHLDLTGLPPTPDELDAFLADPAPDAYERVVERLLTEEPYLTRVAEHLASPWLDAARYADTIGIHTDNGRQMWAWRDWVLGALRDGVPYDRFVVDQLAGDLIDDASRDQRIATGFLRSHVITDEGGAIDEEYLIEYAVERTNTVGTVFLGLTVGCARCHDHKYDPITQTDYYGLMSFFNSNDEPGLYSQMPNPQRAFEPFLEAPSAEQEQRLAELEDEVEALVRRLEEPLPQELEKRAAFLDDFASGSGVAWTRPEVLDARSSDERVTLSPRDDGSIVASGPMPDFEDYTITLRADAGDALRALLVEALATPDEDGTVSNPGAGRAFHGNAVVSRARLAWRPAGSDAAWQDVPLRWAWSDHVQTNGDFEPGNLLDDDALGWALDGNAAAGERVLVMLADESFGHADGTDLRLSLAFRSRYAQHSIGRLRVHASPLDDVARLPVMAGRWYGVGPFAPPEDDRYADLGPGAVTRIDTAARFGPDDRAWGFRGGDVDGQVNGLGSKVGTMYVARSLWSPDARDVELALGSDDGVIVWLNGEAVFERRVDRGAALDQDRTTLSLQPGHNVVVMQIVNTGGPSAYAFELQPAPPALSRPLVAALVPQHALTDATREGWVTTWRREVFDEYRRLDDERSATLEAIDTLRDEVPRTMVMRERDEPRETFVLMRGAYDAPDRSRPTPRDTPSFLPPMPDDARRDRLGLARWMVSADNPLFARVAVNRVWQGLFGDGLVRTPEDFGVQGDRPTHPELLDWLAVDFREGGWDLRALLRSIVTSSTYRQASARRPELDERDPDDRWLHRYPRRRLTAEQTRDAALFTSGLLVERLGGPSVKPYQPEGLWREVSMLQSNTRDFERGDGDDLWRRSLYTYWKRAVPPPSLLTFDAPTRESCVVKRATTNTPLQALVLWNDEQYVEAARALAERTLQEADDDAARVTRMFRRATGRTLDDDEVARILAALDDYRARYADDEPAAASLTSVGEAMAPSDVAPAELAAWTLVANAALNLHETLTQR